MLDPSGSHCPLNGVHEVSFRCFSNVIDGGLRSASSFYHGVNPATQEDLWPAPVATEEDVDDAVAAAQTAYMQWKKVVWKTRKEKLLDFTNKLMEHEKAFTELIIQETGKPRFLAEAEMKIFVATIEHFTELTLPIETEHDDSKFVKTSYVPLGVVAAIGPWNCMTYYSNITPDNIADGAMYPVPVALFSNKLGPAVLAGNSIILKPSPFTPYSILKVAEIAQQVFPPGLVQCLGGDDQLGPMLTHHPKIQKVAFTGSVAIGKKIMAACAQTIKRVTLEMGGNDAAIVCPDVDVDRVASELVMGFFLNTGQVCVASKRVFIHQDVYEQMCTALAKCARQTMKVGGDQTGVMMGPLQNRMQYEKVKELLAEVKSYGSRFVLGESDISSSKGFFIPPTIIDNPPTHSRLMKEEQFGPIMPLQAWTDEEDVIQRANDTKMGLSGCVWSKDVHRACRIGEQLEVGSVYINSTQKPSPQGVFGGHKESGLGVEFRLQGLLAYCNAQSQYVNY